MRLLKPGPPLVDGEETVVELEPAEGGLGGFELDELKDIV